MGGIPEKEEDSSFILSWDENFWKNNDLWIHVKIVYACEVDNFSRHFSVMKLWNILVIMIYTTLSFVHTIHSVIFLSNLGIYLTKYFHYCTAGFSKDLIRKPIAGKSVHS